MSGGSSSIKTVKFKSPGDAAASPHLYVAPPMGSVHPELREYKSRHTLLGMHALVMSLKRIL